RERRRTSPFGDRSARTRKQWHVSVRRDYSGVRLTPTALHLRLLGLHQHIGSRCVFDWLQAAVAGLACVDFSVVECFEPFAPFRPPGAGTVLGFGEPLLGILRIVLAGLLRADPVAILIRSGGIHDTGDMA